jgi:hypothetical protein
VYETFSKDLNGILNTHIAAKKTHKPKPKPNPAPFSLSLSPSLSLSLLYLSVLLVLLGIPEAKPFSLSLSLRVCQQKNKTPQIDRSLNTTMFSGEPKPLRVGVCVWGCAQSLSLSVQCPSRKSDVPTSQLSIVSTTTTLCYFFEATNV